MFWLSALIVITLVSGALAQEPVVLRLEVGANQAEFETRKLALDEFERLNPDIKVELVMLSGWTAERLTRYAGGSAPDVTMEWELEFAQFANQGVYLDLTPFIEKDPEFQAYLHNDVLTPLLGAFQWEGKQLGLPEQNAPVVMFYNKDLLSEAGLAEPTMEWDDPSWNWDVFLDYAKKMTRTQGTEITHYGYGDMWWTQLSMMMMGWSNNGQWFDNQAAPTRSMMNNPNMVEAIQFYADLWLLHEVAPTWPERVQEDTVDRFASGRLGMGITGHWLVPMFKEAGINFDVAPIPMGPQGTSGMTDLGTTGLAIYNTTQHPEEAWRLVKFLAGHEGQKVYAESGLFVPVTRTAAHEFLAAEPHTERAWIFLSAPNHANLLPIFPEWPEYVGAVFNPELHRVMEGEVPASHAAEILDNWTNAAIFGRD